MFNDIKDRLKNKKGYDSIGWNEKKALEEIKEKSIGKYHQQQRNLTMRVIPKNIL